MRPRVTPRVPADNIETSNINVKEQLLVKNRTSRLSVWLRGVIGRGAGGGAIVLLVVACLFAGMTIAGVGLLATTTPLVFSSTAARAASRAVSSSPSASATHTVIQHRGHTHVVPRATASGDVKGGGDDDDRKKKKETGGGGGKLTPTLTTREGVAMPRMLYGTAWKGDRTADLVAAAIRAGFRGVDTACQPKHYQEKGVGDAIAAVAAAKDASPPVTREDLFLQTKYTPIRGQDPENVPYDPASSIPAQVAQSFARSRVNLRTDYVDSLVLHSPFDKHEDTMLAWRAMEALYDSGGVRQLGISNQYDIHGFKQLFADARVKPAVLQNRFYAESGYDVELREFCRENDVVYQSFWTLTANRDILFDEAKGGGVKKGSADEAGRVAARQAVAAASAAHGKTPAQIWFRWLQQGLGIAPLSGTTDPAHMAEDLDVFLNDGDFALTVEEMDAIQTGVLGGGR